MATLPSPVEVNLPGRILARTGLDSQIPGAALRLGEIAFTTDSSRFWVGDDSQNPPWMLTSKYRGNVDWTGLNPTFGNLNVSTINGQTLAQVVAANGGGGAQPTLQSNTSFYVNASTGSDTNTGLANSPFATIQAAINAVSKFNLNGFSVTINVANGTYPKIVLLPTSGSGQVVIQGNTSSPNLVIIAGVNDNAVFGPACGQAYAITGVTFTTSGSSSTSSMGGIVATGSGTTIQIYNVGFGACVGGHIIAAQKALIYVGGALNISGGCTGGFAVAYGSSLVAGDGGTIISIPGFNPIVTITNTPNFPQGFAYASTLSEISFPATITGAATGPRYTALVTSVISSNGGGPNAFPGNSAGSYDATSRYI